MTTTIPAADAALLEQASSLAAPYATEPPTSAQLQALCSQHGIALASAIFYMALRQSSHHGAWIQHVDACPPVSAPSGRAAQLLIVPALFYQERPEFGGDGAALADVARTLGLRVHLVPVQSRGSMSTNAAIVWQVIQDADGPIWLASLSKGSGEVRLALQRYADEGAWEKVRGWLNISGLVRGTPLAALYPLGLRAFFMLAKVAQAAAVELQPGHPHWQRPFVSPAHMQVINVIGVPLLRHIQQRNMRWRYGRLAQLGPNDGMAPLADLLVQPGHIYPVWGADHFLRHAAVRPLFHRLLQLFCA